MSSELVAQLVEALEGLMPSNLKNIPEWLDDSYIFPLDVSAGEMRKARAAISKATLPTDKGGV